MSVYNPRWPDFHGWFPNQAFRRERHNKQKMIQDLDRILEESNFPLNKFNEFMAEWESSRRIRDIYVNARKSGREPTKEEEKEMDSIEAYSEKALKELDELIDPLYQRMLDMGYSHEQLRYLS